jgi:biopolymer transport protein ExbD
MAGPRIHYMGHEEKARIEINPMIDVMMFLLVFFVLIMLQMLQSTGITLDLPRAATSTQLETIKVTIAVDKQGAMFVETRPTNRDELLAFLGGLQKTNKVDVIIAGDKLTAYDNVVKVMDVVREAGINAIALATNSQS